MSEESVRIAGILLITVPTIALGKAPSGDLETGAGVPDNPVRQNLWRAGHARAGVLVILALLGMLYVDQTNLSEGLAWLLRLLLVLRPILMPLGFFLSVASPRSEKPNALIYLVPLGGLLLAAGALALGIGLVSD